MSVPTVFFDWSMAIGEDRVLNPTIYQPDGVTPQDVGGWTTQLVVHAPYNSAAVYFTIAGIVQSPSAKGIIWYIIPNAITLNMLPGQYGFYIQRTDAGNNAYITEGLLTLDQPRVVTPITLMLGALSPTSAFTSTPYTGTAAISGGLAPYSVLSTTGLPPGLTASIAGSTLTISGTPTTVGTYNLTITIADSTQLTNQVITQPYTIVVALAPIMVWDTTTEVWDSTLFTWS